MTFFDDMKVSLKLSVLILIAIISLGIMGFTGYYYLQQSNTKMNTMYTERLIPFKLTNQIRTNTVIANATTLEMMITTDNKRHQEFTKIFDELGKSSNDCYAELEKLHLDSKGNDLLTKIKIPRQKYKDARSQVVELALQNKKAEGYALYVANVNPLAIEYINNLRDITDYYSTLAEKTNADNQAEFEKSIQITIGILMIAFVVLGLSGFFIAKMITKPLQVMIVACENLAAGDFRDKKHTFTRKDEIGQVGDALVDMRNSLRLLMKNVNESSEQLAASSEELTASAEQSAQAANQVAESITEVATSAEKQLKEVGETSAVVEQMSAGIQQVAANTNFVAVKSAQAAETAKEGGKSVEMAVTQMDHIERTVNNSAQVVAKLGERSKEIGQIVDTISGIAGQTNLLALNAAIEAARAGEQGRGFAVVAEEVRKLAEQSQEAAKKIAALISEIQGDTDQAVVAMSEGTHEVKVGTEVVTTAGRAFGEIATLVMEVSNEVKEISAAAQQMASGSQQIVASVKEIDGYSKKTSGEAQTVSAATEEQSASMEEIAASSQSLAKLAQDLQTAVGKFQV